MLRQKVSTCCSEEILANDEACFLATSVSAERDFDRKKQYTDLGKWKKQLKHRSRLRESPIKKAERDRDRDRDGDNRLEEEEKRKRDWEKEKERERLKERVREKDIKREREREREREIERKSGFIERKGPTGEYEKASFRK